MQTTQTTQIMRSKSHTRTDVQWIISSVSLAVTLGLWGLLASAQKKGAGVEGTVQVVQPPDPVVVTTAQPQTLLPGQVLLLGGAVPQPAQQTVVSTSGGTTTTKHRSGGGGGAAASTHSSHP